MSSPIHAARCVSRDGPVVDIELVPTESSGACFPLSPFFGLSLLHEAATTLVTMQGGPLWRSVDKPGGPIASEVSGEELAELTDVETPDDQLMRPPTPEERRAMRERKRSLVERFVAQVTYVATKHWQPSLCPLESGAYRRPIGPGEERYREGCVRLQGLFDGVEERMRPSATMRVEATASKWTIHLDVGMCWDVYAFDSDAGLLL